MSGWLFGKGGGAVSKSAPEVSSLRITTANYGRPIPLGWGTFKIAAFILWYGDFKAIAHTETQSVGGKGGGGGEVSTTSYTYQAACIMGMCENRVTNILSAWVGKNVYALTTTSSKVKTKMEAQIVSASFAITIAPPGTVSGTSATFRYWANAWDLQPVTLTEGIDFGRVGNVYTFTTTIPAGTVGQLVYSYTDPVAKDNPLTKINATLSDGSYSQSAWSWLTSNHPTEALNYRGIAHVDSSVYDLGGNPDFPNTSFEVESRFIHSSTIKDANPKDVIVDLLTNPYYGAYFTTQGIADWSQYSTYCIAAGLFISPCYTEQEACHEIITRILAQTNSDVVLSDKKLKIVPYADQAVTGNSVTFTPDLTAIYALTEDHFGPQEGGAVRIQRKSPNERYNQMKLKFRNRAKQYNDDIWDAKDEAEIGRNGVRSLPNDQDSPEVKDLAVAVKVANLVLQRLCNVCNTYTFMLPFRFACLEPLDLVTITYFAARLGLSAKLVRITQIAEVSDEWLSVEAEEVPIGHATSVLYEASTAYGYLVNFNTPPLSIVAPFFFEAPTENAGETGLAVWCAIAGQSSDPAWGGANVWVSNDGASYKKVGTIIGGSRYGTLRSTIATTGNIPVQLAGKGGQLLSGSASDALNRATLCYIENAGAGEFFSYQTATLDATNQYTLSSNVRGQLSTTAAAAGSGSKFVRIDDAIFKGDPLPLDMIGKVLHFKFTSFNIYQAGEQGLADVTDYTYTVRGNIVSIPPSPPANLAYTLEEFGIRVRCDKNPTGELVLSYHWKLGATYATALDLNQAGGTSQDIRVQTTGTYTVWVAARDNVGYESDPVSISIVIAQAPAPTALTPTIIGDSLDLAWGPPSSVASSVTEYEVRYGGTDFASATFVARTKALFLRQKVTWSGARTFRVAAIVAPNSTGAAASVDVTITAPGAATALRTQVVDNNVMIYWALPATGTLPVENYVVRSGTSFAGGVTVGDNGNSTFAAVINQQSGDYTYWVRAYDSAGNAGADTSITATVNQPPDYVLRVDYNSDFSGTKTGTYIDIGKLYGPAPGESWDTHFASRGWSTINAQLTAGYPYYFEPSSGAASYEEVIDYGTALPSTTLTVTVTSAVLFGAVTQTVTLSYKLNSGDPWTDATPGQTSILISNFRYIKVYIDLAASGGDDLLEISNINIKLASKLKTDAGSVSALSTDTGGTVYTFGTTFVDVTAITATPFATTPCFAIVDFVDAPNPTSCKVLVYDKDGNRVSKTCSVNVRGY